MCGRNLSGISSNMATSILSVFLYCIGSVRVRVGMRFCQAPCCCLFWSQLATHILLRRRCRRCAWAGLLASSSSSNTAHASAMLVKVVCSKINGKSSVSMLAMSSARGHNLSVWQMLLKCAKNLERPLYIAWK